MDTSRWLIRSQRWCETVVLGVCRQRDDLFSTLEFFATCFDPLFELVEVVGLPYCLTRHDS